MSAAAELIHDVRTAKGLLLKQVSLISGYSKSAINAYERGLLPVPFDYIPGLFRATGDLRLVQYIWPSVQIVDVPRSNPAPASADPQATNTRLLEAIQQLAEVAKYNARVLADGRIDAADHESILREQELLNRVATTLAEHQVALAAWRERIRGPAASEYGRTHRRQPPPMDSA